MLYLLKVVMVLVAKTRRSPWHSSPQIVTTSEPEIVADLIGHQVLTQVAKATPDFRIVQNVTHQGSPDNSGPGRRVGSFGSCCAFQLLNPFDIPTKVAKTRRLTIVFGSQQQPLRKAQNPVSAGMHIGFWQWCPFRIRLPSTDKARGDIPNGAVPAINRLIHGSGRAPGERRYSFPVEILLGR